MLTFAAFLSVLGIGTHYDLSDPKQLRALCKDDVGQSSPEYCDGARDEFERKRCFEALEPKLKALYLGTATITAVPSFSEYDFERKKFTLVADELLEADGISAKVRWGHLGGWQSEDSGENVCEPDQLCFSHKVEDAAVAEKMKRDRKKYRVLMTVKFSACPVDSHDDRQDGIHHLFAANARLLTGKKQTVKEFWRCTLATREIVKAELTDANGTKIADLVLSKVPPRMLEDKEFVVEALVRDKAKTAAK